MMKKLLAVARGDAPADLVLKNARIVCTFTGEIIEGDVAILGEMIAGIGSGYEGREQMDLGCAYVSPGLIESHFHIESTMLRPSELAGLIVPLGTTCLVADPHEIANVSGVAGIEFMLADSEDLPLDLYLMAPSCVPATGFETSGAAITTRDIEHLYGHPRVLGLAEVMNFPGVVYGDEAVLGKIEMSSGRIVDGHAPMLTGKQLNAYVAAGIMSDHECTSKDEALEKMRLGMRLMIREGTSARDMEKLLPAVDDRNSRRCMMVTDDRHADEIAELGHVDLLLRKAVSLGMEPVEALRMVTLNAAEYFGLRGRGAVAPGYLADLVVFEDLEGFSVRKVVKSGVIVAREGYLTVEIGGSTVQHGLLDTVNLDRVREEQLYITFSSGTALARVVDLVPGAIITKSSIVEIRLDENGRFAHDDKADLASLYVIERHRGTGNIGKGIVRGFGLRKGAIASTVAHDSHNVICAAYDVESAAAAVNALIESGGGYSVAVGGEVRYVLPLPISGLISDSGAEELISGKKRLLESVRETGCSMDDPFMTLSFLALPVIPELKLTDMGLFDVNAFSPVELEVAE